MTDPAPTEEAPARRGRPRDPARDHAILNAALDLLEQDGYDLLTIERVAAAAGTGKATVYRRWSSKHDLVLDAVALVKPVPTYEDTGSLDSDVERMICSSCDARAERAERVMCAITSAVQREPSLQETFRLRFLEPRVAAIAAMLERARERGELAAAVDIELVAGIVPSLMFQHLLVHGRPGGAELAHRIVDHVLRPALGIAPPTTEGPST